MIKYYSAIKKIEILPFVTMWITLEDIMLSGISQAQKDKYCMISLVCQIKKVDLLDIECNGHCSGLEWLGVLGRYRSKAIEFQIDQRNNFKSSIVQHSQYNILYS
jgi:hypothetical protein